MMFIRNYTFYKLSSNKYLLLNLDFPPFINQSIDSNNLLIYSRYYGVEELLVTNGFI